MGSTFYLFMFVVVFTDLLPRDLLRKGTCLYGSEYFRSSDVSFLGMVIIFRDFSWGLGFFLGSDSSETTEASLSLFDWLLLLT